MGGKALVPDDASKLFLNVYAARAMSADSMPCLTEMRTPVFKLFMDLDIKHPAEDPLDVEAVVRLLQDRASMFFDLRGSTHDHLPRAIVCCTEPTAVDVGGAPYIKRGRHVVWTNIFCTSVTALAFRDAVLDDLAPLQSKTPPGKGWADVVDDRVFKANGLRMPFSGKGRDNTTTYTPSEVWLGSVKVEDVGTVKGLTEMRRWVHDLSIRAFGQEETPLADGVVIAAPDDEAKAGGKAFSGVSTNLAPYAAVLQMLDDALPVQFAGQRFTGLLKCDTCFILRSNSRYCLNLGRMHNGTNVYFRLTPAGIEQRCYCTCDTTEGRKHGLCKNYRSDMWPVPKEVVAAFFGENTAAAPTPAASALPPLPSAPKSFLQFLGLDPRQQHARRCKRRKN
jgi:hypothetical protein